MILPNTIDWFIFLKSYDRKSFGSQWLLFQTQSPSINLLRINISDSTNAFLDSLSFGGRTTYPQVTAIASDLKHAHHE
jgi:hypothetical protein